MTEKKPHPSSSPKTRPYKPRPVGDDEKLLWDVATQDVRPTHKKRPASLPDATPLSLPPKPPVPSPLMAPPPKTQDKSPSGRQVDSALKKRFVRGDLPIEGRIDLHGLTVAQAHDRFLRFMLRQIASEVRCVLVITGKGRGGEGLIRKNLPLWCEDEKLHPFILQSVAAAPKDGGAGAVYFLLRRRRK